MVQGLRLCASNTGGVGSILGWGTKIPRAARCSQKIMKNKIKCSFLRLAKWESGQHTRKGLQPRPGDKKGTKQKGNLTEGKCRGGWTTSRHPTVTGTGPSSWKATPCAYWRKILLLGLWAHNKIDRWVPAKHKMMGRKKKRFLWLIPWFLKILLTNSKGSNWSASYLTACQNEIQHSFREYNQYSHQIL